MKVIDHFIGAHAVVHAHGAAFAIVTIKLALVVKRQRGAVGVAAFCQAMAPDGVVFDQGLALLFDGAEAVEGIEGALNTTPVRPLDGGLVAHGVKFALDGSAVLGFADGDSVTFPARLYTTYDVTAWFLCGDLYGILDTMAV